MRVLYVNHTAEVSGGERSLLSLLSALPPQVDARLATAKGRLWQEADALGVPLIPITATAGSLRLHPLHTPRALGELGLAAAQARRAAHLHRADVVHANSIRAGVALALARPRSSATVVHVRDCLPASPLASATLRLIGFSASAVIANSHHTARSLLRMAPGARVEVLHSPVDLRRFDPWRIDRAAVRAALGPAGERRPLLGVVAQLSPWKGQDVAIEALRLLREQAVDAHLLLIGSAKFAAKATRYDNRRYVQQLKAQVSAAGLEDRVSWLGEREDVPELVRALDVLLLPSSEEPFGRALIEAMAMAVPVIATDVGGPAEIISDGREGHLLPPREPRAWAQAIRRLSDGPARAAEMGLAGRRRVQDAFTLQRHVDATISLYERLVDRTRARAGAHSIARGDVDR